MSGFTKRWGGGVVLYSDLNIEKNIEKKIEHTNN